MFLLFWLSRIVIVKDTLFDLPQYKLISFQMNKKTQFEMKSDN